ncbi:hypothetical protein FGIG_10499 [Fasciola gigantica]|uniref:Uncharacterized protein n=1 Tax=Fasciola gigantica TaxID=46835 RepID=A0A504Y884_FASGI|nr:hypothetical protein FGIG_10499 [Fasciola gigantica]
MSSEGDFDWRGDQIGRRDETEESEAKREHEGVEEQFSGVSAVREGGYVEGRGFDASGYGDRDDLENMGYVEGRGFDASGYGDRDDLENIVRESDQLQSHIPEDDDAFRATASGEVEHVLSAAMSSEGDFDWRGDQIGRRDETEESEAKREHEGVEEQFSGVSAVREGGYVEGRGFDASGYGDRDDLENIVRESDQLQSHIPEDDDAFRATAFCSVLDDRFSSENAAFNRASTVSCTFSFDVFPKSHLSSCGPESHPFEPDSAHLVPRDTDLASGIFPDLVGLLPSSDASGGEVGHASNGTHSTRNRLDVESSHVPSVVSADGSDDNYQKHSLFGLESSPGVVSLRDNIRSSLTGEPHDVTSKCDIFDSSKSLVSEEDVI